MVSGDRLSFRFPQDSSPWNSHQLFSSCEGDSLWIQHCSEALLGAGDTHAVEHLHGELLLVSEMKFHF